MQKLWVLMSSKRSSQNIRSTFARISSYTEELLSHKNYAKIHSVFPNGFNLNFDGELIYMSYHQEGMLSAIGLTIDKAVFTALHPYLKEGVHVRFRSNQLMFYTRPNVFMIEITDQTIEHLKVVPVSRKTLKKVDLEENLEALDLFNQSGFSSNQTLFNVLEDIQKAKEVKVSHAKQLIGGGVGLTPTGDDFLQGLILMEQTLKQLPHIQEIVQTQLKERSTTDVSLSYYKALFKGYSNEPLVLLFEAVKNNDLEQVQEALSLVEEYGETSGYDLLTGILTYLQIL